jgi:hypothetical protein
LPRAQVYPERDITNIVESSHYVKIGSWCKLGKKKCRGGSQQWVKPFRCLGEWIGGSRLQSGFIHEFA